MEKLQILATENSKRPPSVEDFIPHLAHDSVIFGFNGKQLKILVLEYHNTGLFALPGGFVRRDEDLDEAVKRGLHERTGLDDIFLEQFHTFGNCDRMRKDQMQAILKGNDFEDFENHWMLDRFVSVAYYALINYNEVNPQPDALSDSINWYPINALPPLIMDHREMVHTALQVLRQNLDRKLVGMSLLPEKFTMKELQQVYEAVLGEKLRRTSFQRKMLNLDILDRHEKLFSGRAHKAPFLYSFKSKSHQIELRHG